MRNRAVLGLFVHVDDLVSAVRRLIAAGHAPETVFSPLPLPEIQELVGAKASSVRIIVFFGAVAGGASLIALATYAHLAYSLITGGKPVLPWIAWVVVCFEGIILGGVISAAVSWVLKGRLPRLRKPEGYDGAFSRDRFGVLVKYGLDEAGSIRKVLQEEGAEEVRDVR